MAKSKYHSVVDHTPTAGVDVEAQGCPRVWIFPGDLHESPMGRLIDSRSAGLILFGSQSPTALDLLSQFTGGSAISYYAFVPAYSFLF